MVKSLKGNAKFRGIPVDWYNNFIRRKQRRDKKKAKNIVRRLILAKKITGNNAAELGQNLADVRL